MTGFPSWRYGPDGEAQVFACEADVPEGWSDRQMPALPPKLENIVEGVADLAAQVSAMDGDGDGRIGGSLPKAKRKKAVKRGDSR